MVPRWLFSLQAILRKLHARRSSDGKSGKNGTIQSSERIGQWFLQVDNGHKSRWIQSDSRRCYNCCDD